MKKITLKIDGMMCGMCENHVNDCIRSNFKVKSVKSSHILNETVIVSEDLDEDALKEAINKTGYKVISVKKEDYVKKGLFSFLHK